MYYIVVYVLGSRLLAEHHAVNRSTYFLIDGLIVRDEAYYNEIICKPELNLKVLYNMNTHVFDKGKWVECQC